MTKWNKRLKEAIGTLRWTVYYDHFYIGGGNAKGDSLRPGPHLTIISNEAGSRGRIALWQRPRCRLDYSAALLDRRPIGRSAPPTSSRRGHQTTTSSRRAKAVSVGCGGSSIPAAVETVFQRIFASTGWSAHGAWWISVR